MKHFVHSGNWIVEGVTGDDPRITCRVARGGLKTKGETVSLGIGPGVRLESGFVAQTGETRAVLYIGHDEGVAERVARDFDKRGRHTVASRARQQGIRLSGVNLAMVLPEHKFRLERNGSGWRAALGEDQSDELLLFAAFEGGGGGFGDVSVLREATTATAIGQAHAKAMDGASLAMIARLKAGERLVIERIRARDQERDVEWDVVVLTYHGTSQAVEFTEERMSLRRWVEKMKLATEAEAKVSA